MRRVLTAMLTVAMAASTFSAAQAADDANIGIRMASFVVGTGVGTPISIVREQYKNVVNFDKAMTGNSKNMMFRAAVLPIAAVSGIANGLMHGPIHAMKHAWEADPFTADTFSLGNHKD